MWFLKFKYISHLRTKSVFLVNLDSYHVLGTKATDLLPLSVYNICFVSKTAAQTCICIPRLERTRILLHSSLGWKQTSHFWILLHIACLDIYTNKWENRNFCFPGKKYSEKVLQMISQNIRILPWLYTTKSRPVGPDCGV